MTPQELEALEQACEKRTHALMHALGTLLQYDRFDVVCLALLNLLVGYLKSEQRVPEEMAWFASRFDMMAEHLEAAAHAALDRAGFPERVRAPQADESEAEDDAPPRAETPKPHLH